MYHKQTIKTIKIMIYEFWKEGIGKIKVSMDDLKEYYKWVNGELETTRVLEVLDNNVADYEDLMGEYARVIEGE